MLNVPFSIQILSCWTEQSSEGRPSLRSPLIYLAKNEATTIALSNSWLLNETTPPKDLWKQKRWWWFLTYTLVIDNIAGDTSTVKEALYDP